MTQQTFRAWAIDTKSVEGHKFIGRYWWGIPLPEHMEGCQVALFKFKRLAERDLPHVRQTFEKAQIVRVEVEVTKVRVVT